MRITGHFYKQAVFSFTSGTSKGTSSPLFRRISATIRRVLSLGMTFSSCIFVQTASAFFESFVSSEIIRLFDVIQPREGVSAHISFSKVLHAERDNQSTNLIN